MSDERKIIIISGGSRGLGKALVCDLLEAGHVVATFSRSVSEFVEAYRARDPDAESFYWEAVDGRDFQQLTRFVMTVIRRYGRVDVLVNNAGVGIDGILTLTPETDIHRGIALNLEAAILLTRACMKSMLERGDGCIINISSVNGVRGHSGVSVYSATKAALDGLTRSLAREVGPAGIRVNSVAPGYFESEMTATLTEAQRARIVRRTPLRRVGTAEELAGVVRFLISPAASYITGQVLVADGGMTC